MNPVLILTHNCLELTKKCVESVRLQDIPTKVYLADNGSTDGTKEWYITSMSGKSWWNWPENRGVSAGWNEGLGMLLSQSAFDHVLVLNNDTILPSWFYRELLSYDVPFITGTSVDKMAEIAEPRRPQAVADVPDFSAFLLRRSAWEAVGPFDERMKNYYSDNDWHIRAHRAGVTLWNSGVPFYHERSSTLKTAPPKEQRTLELQSTSDREIFHSIYGCYTSEPAYQALFR